MQGVSKSTRKPRKRPEGPPTTPKEFCSRVKKGWEEPFSFQALMSNDWITVLCLLYSIEDTRELKAIRAAGPMGYEDSKMLDWMIDDHLKTLERLEYRFKNKEEILDENERLSSFSAEDMVALHILRYHYS